jgi:hypothetical protein
MPHYLRWYLKALGHAWFGWLFPRTTNTPVNPSR